MKFLLYALGITVAFVGCFFSLVPIISDLLDGNLSFLKLSLHLIGFYLSSAFGGFVQQWEERNWVENEVISFERLRWVGSI